MIRVQSKGVFIIYGEGGTSKWEGGSERFYSGSGEEVGGRGGGKFEG